MPPVAQAMSDKCSYALKVKLHWETGSQILANFMIHEESPAMIIYILSGKKTGCFSVLSEYFVVTGDNLEAGKHAPSASSINSDVAH